MFRRDIASPDGLEQVFDRSFSNNAHGSRMTVSGDGDGSSGVTPLRELGRVGDTAFLASADDCNMPWVDVAVHCMFARDRLGSAPSGRIHDVDQLLGGALVRLRGDGFFGGAVGDVLTLTNVPSALGAGRLVVIGLGEPDHWSPSIMLDASARAMDEVIRGGTVSASFTPCFAECIGDPEAVALAYAQIGLGATRSLRGLLSLGAEERAKSHSLEKWIFDLAGAPSSEAFAALASSFDGKQALS